MNWRESIAATLVLVGTAFNLLGAVGLLRFPSVLARMHPATKSLTLGLTSVLVGSALAVTSVGDAVQLLLVAGLQFVTAPIAAHMVGRAAYHAYPQVRAQLSLDELAGPEGLAGSSHRRPVG